jgi:hypothetical protein
MFSFSIVLSMFIAGAKKTKTDSERSESVHQLAACAIARAKHRIRFGRGIRQCPKIILARQAVDVNHFFSCENPVLAARQNYTWFLGFVNLQSRDLPCKRWLRKDGCSEISRTPIELSDGKRESLSASGQAFANLNQSRQIKLRRCGASQNTSPLRFHLFQFFGAKHPARFVTVRVFFAVGTYGNARFIGNENDGAEFAFVRVRRADGGGGE